MIHLSGDVSYSEGFEKFTAEEDCCYVRGLLFIPGYHAGKESVEQLLLALRQNGEIPFDQLYGAYTCCIVRRTGEVFFFASNSEMHCLYFTEDTVSSSFLELLDYRCRHRLPLTFSSAQICEYYTLGKVFFQKTFLREISIIPNNQYVLYCNGVLRVLSKGITDISGESHLESPQKFFADLAYALSQQHVSSALTGGYDSRLVSTMLYREIPLTLYYATNNPEDPDLSAVKKVAEIIGHPLKIYHTEKPVCDEAFIWEHILQSDGLVGLSLEGDTRIRNFRKNLQQSGADVCLTGDGGVLHKDWEWMQDLPFYHRKHTNLHRFYHQRIAYASCDNGLGEALIPVYQQQEDRFVRSLQQYVRRINTESYDVLYHYVSGSQRLGYNHDVPGFVSYAPLWELDLVRWSYHLPRRTRFFYNFIRQLTTEANPEIARIPTNYGTTASSEGRYLFRDVFYQLAQYAEKAHRLLWRTLFRKTPSCASAKPLIEWSLEPDLRALSLAQQAVAWGIQTRYLSTDTTAEQLPYAQLTRTIHLYLLKEHYQIDTET